MPTPSDLRWRIGVGAYIAAVLATAAVAWWSTRADDSGLGSIWIILATLPGSIPAVALPVDGDAFTAVLVLVGLAQAWVLLGMRRLLHR